MRGGGGGRIAVVLGFAALALTVSASPAIACTRLGGVGVGDCVKDTSKARTRPSPEQILLKSLNDERRSRGLAPLTVDPRARDTAEAHARRMAEKGRIYHNPALRTSAGRRTLGNPESIGENVGVGPDAKSVHTAFMRSSRHRSNIIHGGFEHVGIGAVRKDGSLWVVQVFLSHPRAGSPSPPRAASAPRAGATDAETSRAPSDEEAAPVVLEDSTVDGRVGPLPLRDPFGATFLPDADAPGGSVAWSLTVLGLSTPAALHGMGHYRRRRSRAP